MSEFPRPVRIDMLGDGPRTIEIAAEPGERAALARRFDLVALDRLAATAEVKRRGATVEMAGRFEAEVVQRCVATGGEVPARLAEPFALRFVPEAQAGGDEVELDEGALDELPYTDGDVDLGEAVAQSLALALDPFPRCADADAALRQVGVLREGEAAASGPLAGLRDLLRK